MPLNRKQGNLKPKSCSTGWTSGCYTWGDHRGRPCSCTGARCSTEQAPHSHYTRVMGGLRQVLDLHPHEGLDKTLHLQHCEWLGHFCTITPPSSVYHWYFPCSISNFDVVVLFIFYLLSEIGSSKESMLAWSWNSPCFWTPRSGVIWHSLAPFHISFSLCSTFSWRQFLPLSTLFYSSIPVPSPCYLIL